MSVEQWLFHQITDKNYVFTAESGHRPPEQDEASDQLFLARLGGQVDFTDKTVLDVGCGAGSLCGLAAKKGASRIVGTDLEVVNAERVVRERFGEVADRISFVATEGQLSELGEQEFDVVISKDSMEHFQEPESFVHLMADRVGPGGELVIGFSPTWRSPKGGHIDFMTKVPWAHLVFSEETIMAERRRFRPDEPAERFSEIKGGLNKMTFERFLAIMASTGLKPKYLETNVSDRRSMKVMKVIAKLPPLREYFTASIYSIWTKPGPTGA